MIVPSLDAVKLHYDDIIIGVVADDVQFMMVGGHDTIASEPSSAMAFVVGEFDHNGMTVSMKQSKLVMLTTHWKDRVTCLDQCKRNIAATCNRDAADLISIGCIARSARYPCADVCFSGKRSTAVQEARHSEASKRERKLKAIRKFCRQSRLDCSNGAPKMCPICSRMRHEPLYIKPSSRPQ